MNYASVPVFAELATETWADQLYGDPWGDLIRAATGCQQEFSIRMGRTAYQRLVQHLDTAPRFQQWFGSGLVSSQHMPLLEDYTSQRSILVHGKLCILALVGFLTGAREVIIGARDECQHDSVLFVVQKTESNLCEAYAADVDTLTALIEERHQ